MMSMPRVRTARFGDIPAIYEIMCETHARSRYADICKIDEKRAKALVMQAIQRHGGAIEGSTFVAVADTGNGLEGFIIGVLQPLYLVLDVLEATDLFWGTRDAHGATAARLLKAMHKWVPAGTVIRQANTNAVSNIELSGRLLERRGMRLTGHVYEKTKEASK